MRKDAKVVVCDKHDGVYHTIKGVGYEYDSSLWPECPLCFVFGQSARCAELQKRGIIYAGEVDDRMVADRFCLDLLPGDLVEVWASIPSFGVGLNQALASRGLAKPLEYDGLRFMFDAVVETYFLSPMWDPGKELIFDPNWEYGVIRGINGGRFMIDRVPWPTGRLEFAGPHPEDEEFTIRSFDAEATLDEWGLPNIVDDRTQGSVRIYKKEGRKQ